MSLLCEIILAVGLTFGCPEDVPEGAAPRLEGDQPAAWTFTAPPPPPAPPPPKQPLPPPVMPPVIIKQPPPVVAPPPPVMPPPPPPDPVVVALSHAFAQPVRFSTHDVIAGPGRVGAALPTPGAASGVASDNSSSLTLPPPPPSYQHKRRQSSQPVDNSRLIATDRYITGIIETGINSQHDSGNGGQVIIQTSRDVFGYHGRNILLPKGSRLVCDYDSPKAAGITRITLNCSRVLIAGHRAEIYSTATRVGNQQGQGGISGEVDNRFWEKYGTAFLLSGISATVRLASVAATSGDDSNAKQAIADAGSQELSTKLGEITASILEDTVNLVPVITVPQGTRVQLRPTFDWYISQPAGGTS